MKRANILNKRIETLFQVKQNQDLAAKIKTMKPLVNIKCPESFLFYKTQFHTYKTQPNACK